MSSLEGIMGFIDKVLLLHLLHGLLGVNLVRVGVALSRLLLVAGGQSSHEATLLSTAILHSKRHQFGLLALRQLLLLTSSRGAHSDI